MGIEGLLVLEEVIWKHKKWWLKSDMFAIKITEASELLMMATVKV